MGLKQDPNHSLTHLGELLVGRGGVLALSARHVRRGQHVGRKEPVEVVGHVEPVGVGGALGEQPVLELVRGVAEASEQKEGRELRDIEPEG